MRCRHCRQGLETVFLDLGSAPPSNAFLSAEELSRPEVYLPLRLYICDHCWLVQTEDFAEAGALFTNKYPYFSSTSKTWLKHAADYTEMICQRFDISEHSFVVEIGANDGYLLQNFSIAGIPCLGVEPTNNTALSAESKGIVIKHEFFSENLATQIVLEDGLADLVIGNNVFAHVPDVNDFSKGIYNLLKSDGIVTLEFPHLAKMIEHTQFDTAYHEHYSYFSLRVAQKIFKLAGLRIFDVEELPTHGGSLRIFGCRDAARHIETSSVARILNNEDCLMLSDDRGFAGFQENANRVKNNLLEFLLNAKFSGKKVWGYGAAAKGNTLLNYAGIRSDLIGGVCDGSPHKQGRFLPGSRIPVFDPTKLSQERPDYLLVLPWNLVQELSDQLAFVRQWGARFVTAVPELKIF